MQNEYEEAIDYFQKYPDMWKKLLNGIIAKRNSIADQQAEAALSPKFNEREKVVFALACRGTAFDEVARDFAGAYSEPEQVAEKDDEE